MIGWVLNSGNGVVECIGELGRVGSPEGGGSGGAVHYVGGRGRAPAVRADVRRRSVRRGVAGGEEEEEFVFQLVVRGPRCGLHSRRLSGYLRSGTLLIIIALI